MTISPPHLLIVEDDQAIRSLLTVVARRLGLRCSTAANGEEAIRMLESGSGYCGIVLDLMMPAVNGYEVIAYLRRTFQLVPVIVVTATAAGPQRAPLDPLIVKAVVTKPFNLDQLQAAIEAACEPRDGHDPFRRPVDSETL